SRRPYLALIVAGVRGIIVTQSSSAVADPCEVAWPGVLLPRSCLRHGSFPDRCCAADNEVQNHQRPAIVLICQNMRHGTSTLHLNLALCFAAGTVAAQTPVETPPSAVVGKSITAIGYQVGRGATRISLKGTELVPQAGGEAKIEAKKGITTIQIVVSGLVQPTRLGTEFLTYVLWTASPEGRAGNLGELIIDKSGQGKLSATTQYQTFS